MRARRCAWPQETSLQALAMLNSAFVEEQADLLAVRAGMAYSTDAERIDYAYRLLYGRAPTPAELVDCKNYLYQGASWHSRIPDCRPIGNRGRRWRA